MSVCTWEKFYLTHEKCSEFFFVFFFSWVTFGGKQLFLFINISFFRFSLSGYYVVNISFSSSNDFYILNVFLFSCIWKASIYYSIVIWNIFVYRGFTIARFTLLTTFWTGLKFLPFSLKFLKFFFPFLSIAVE